MKQLVLLLIAVGLLNRGLAYRSPSEEELEEPNLDRELHNIELLMLKRPEIGKKKQKHVDRIPELSIDEEEKERWMPIKPLSKVEIDPIHDNAREVIKRYCHKGKCDFARRRRSKKGRRENNDKLQEPSERTTKALKILKQSMDRTKGKFRRCSRKESPKGCNRGRRCPRDDRPIHPWEIKNEEEKMRRVNETPGLVTDKSGGKAFKVNQINLYLDVGMCQQQAQQEKQAILRGKKSTRDGHNYDDVDDNNNRHDSIQERFAESVPISNQPRYTPRHRQLPSQRSYRHKKLNHIRHILGNYERHPPEIDPNYPHDEPFPPYEKPGFTDPKHNQTIWQKIKKMLNRWTKSIKNCLHQMSKQFEGESIWNKIAMVVVIGIIIMFQILVAIKLIASNRGDYEELPSDDYNDDYEKGQCRCPSRHHHYSIADLSKTETN